MYILRVCTGAQILGAPEDGSDVPGKGAIAGPVSMTQVLKQMVKQASGFLRGCSWAFTYIFHVPGFTDGGTS